MKYTKFRDNNPCKSLQEYYFIGEVTTLHWEKKTKKRDFK